MVANVKSMAYAGETPWHKLGVKVEGEMTSKEAIESATEKYSSRHTLSIGENVADIRKSFGLLCGHFKVFEELSKFLVTKQATKQVVANLFRDLGLMSEEKETTRSLNIRTDIVKYYETGKGNNMIGVRGTAWALLNGVVEYADYAKSVRGKTEAERQNNRVGSILFGSGAEMKQKALDSILASVGVR